MPTPNTTHPPPDHTNTANLNLINRIVIKNYKSIAHADVRLSNLSILVGPNGSGKSNFFDAIRFLSDAATTGLSKAISDRGGMANVCNRFTNSNHFAIRIEFDWQDIKCVYAIHVQEGSGVDICLSREECWVTSSRDPFPPDYYALSTNDTDAYPGEFGRYYYVVQDGDFHSSLGSILESIDIDTLAINIMSGIGPFRRVADAIKGMRFYDFAMNEMKTIQAKDPGQVLLRDGSNIAAVIREIKNFRDGEIYDHLIKYLSIVVPDLYDIYAAEIFNDREVSIVRQINPDDDSNPVAFWPTSISHGTMRAIGVLAAAFQVFAGRHSLVSLVGLEEPEMALNPEAANAIIDALFAASERVQILVTTHSPQLLSHQQINSNNLLAVKWHHGSSIIGKFNDASAKALNNQLYSAGELLDMGEIDPDIDLLNTDPSRIFSGIRGSAN